MSDDVFPIDIPSAPVTNPGRFLQRRFPQWDVQDFLALSGKSFRQTWALEPLVTYNVTEACLRSFSPSEYQELLSFLGSHFGALDSFLFTDPEDASASDPSVPGGGMCFGVGNGTQTVFQLQRRVNALRRDRNSGLKYRSSSGPRTNSLLWSDDFTNAAWTKGTGVVAAANGTLAPDNTAASVITYDGSGVAGGARVQQSVAATSTSPVNVSVFLRADAPATIALGPATGPVSTVTLTTSWARYNFNVTPAVGGGIGLIIWSPAGVNTAFRIYAWGAQSELDVANTGTPTKLIPTTTTTLTQNPQFWTSYVDSFLPVYELNGPAQIFRSDYQGIVQLFPWARTNLCLQSQTFGSATWVKTTATVGSATAAPDGTTTALPITATAGGATVVQSVSGLTVGQSYTASIWLLCAAGGTLKISAGATTSSSLTLTSRWQRFSVTFTATATSHSFTLGAGASWSNGEIVQCWGAQLEAGLSATSYIATVVTAVSQTDYALSLGQVTLAVAPVLGAVLSWLGSYYIRVKLDLSAQKGVELTRIVAQMWSTGLQLISVIP